MGFKRVEKKPPFAKTIHIPNSRGGRVVNAVDCSARVVVSIPAEGMFSEILSGHVFRDIISGMNFPM